MSTRRSSNAPTRREDTVVRVLALGAVVAASGGLLVSSQQLPTPAQAAPASVAQVEAELPSYVVAPRATVDARPSDHPAKGRPLIVRVPGLDIAVPVVGIPLADGVLMPPSNPQVLGWWTAGAEPGALHGTAVVTGHTVSTGGGALDDLHILGRGDGVVVVTDDGRIDYEVTEVVRYSKAELARVAGSVFSQDVPGRLVLVTCTDFDGSEYLGNTLAFAEPVR